MKKIIFISFALLLNSFNGFSQVFSNSTASAAGSWNGTLTKTVTVSGLSNLNAGIFELVQVNLHMGDDANTRNYNNYRITLTKGTTSIDLVAVGGFPNSTVKQINTKFRYNTYLKRLFEHGGTAEPFGIGYYRSQDDLNAFNGIDPNGVWTINITETSTATGGRFNKVDLVFKSPFTVQDYTTLNSYDNCSTPYCLGTAEIIVASNNGFTNQSGDMFNSNTASCSWNAAQNNSAWFKFRAVQSAVGITISGITGNLQILAIDAGIDNNPCTPADNILLTGGCPTSSSNDTYSSPQYFNGSTKNNQLNLSGLTIGKFYYFIVDGSGASVSPFYIETTGTSFDCSNCSLNATLGSNSPVCANGTLNLTCNDGTSWSWTGPNGFTSNSQNPTLNNVTSLASGTYTVAITDNNGCTDTKSIDVVVNSFVTPTFNTPSPVCIGSTLNPLPTTSNNGILGQWSPALNNSSTTIYTFTPNSGQCASTTSLTITVNNCDFGAYATAVWMDDCTDLGDGKFYNTTGGGADLVNQEPGNTFIKDFGVHVENSSTLTLRGAEVKTYKNGGTNVCGAKMYYRYYLNSSIGGAFTQRNLAFFSNCNTGTSEFLNGGGPCVAGQQKWQCVSQPGCDTPVNLTAIPPGDYTLEVYYDVTGDFNSTTQCDDTIILNNGGTNYKANFSIIASPTLSSSNPTTCNGTEGSITISGLKANDVYVVSYNFNTTPVGPNNFTSNNNGEILISNLGIGTYSNFSFVINSCTTILPSSVTLQNPVITPVFSTPNPFCFGATVPSTVFPTTSNNGITGSWLPVLNNTATTNYTFTPDSGQCATTNNLTVVINPEINGTTNSNPNTVCNASSSSCTPTGTKVVINEVMHFPLTAQGLVANGTEYIELYNPTCTPIDLSCYTIATAARPNSNPGSTLSRGGTVLIPSGTILAPKSHYVIGTSTSSSNLANIDYNTTLTSNYCSINQFVLANGDGWVSLNDANGTPVDAIYWTVGANESSKITTDDDLDDAPCIPTSLGACNTSSLTLLSAKDIHQLNPSLINYVGQTTLQGLSSTGNTFSRIPDGGTWQRDIPGSINLINCNNGICDTPATSTCNGSATVTITQGSGNYSYLWNDPQAQTTATANNLCAGNYCVTVTDLDTNCIQQFCVTVNDNIPNITPTFSFGTTLSICSGVTVPVLPTSSSNSITGSWSPAIVDNANNGTYTFTPDAGQCANNTTFTVTITPQTTPTFAFGTSLTACQGDVSIQVLLPTLSNNSISGTWNPSTIDYSILGQTIYTFTPDAGQCANNTTFTVTITPQTTPTFSFGTTLSICSGGIVPTLPTTSNNSITGTWSPAIVDNVNNGIYTFTPNSSSSSSPNLIVNGDFSQGNSNFSTDYQFITNAGQSGVQRAYGIVSSANSWFQFFPSCISNAPSGGNMMVVDGSSSNAGNDKVWGQTVTVLPNKTYTFSYWLQTIATPNQALIEIKINGTTLGTALAPNTNCQTTQYTYQWNSGSNTTAQIEIFDRVFIANGNDFSLDDISLVENIPQCVASTTLTVTITPQTTPTFSFGTTSSICSGGIVPSLPTTSGNSITGVWSPAIVDNANNGTYTFTPNTGQCANSTTFTVTITPQITPTFNFGSTLSICSGDSVPTLPNISDNSIIGTWSPAIVDNANNGTYTFTPNTGQCANTTSFTVTVTPQTIPTFGFGTTLTNCQGVSAQVLLPTTSDNFITGSWNPSTIDNSLLGETVYTFTPNSGQCSLNRTLTVTINTIPQFTITGGCDGEDYVLKIEQQNQNINTVEWYFNSNMIGQGNSIVINGEGTYTAVATNSFNCDNSAQFVVSNDFCSIQKGISVNNDGFNDVFELTNLDVKNLQIFNRYGMEVYSKRNYTNEWGGNSNDGDELPDGTYYYVIEQRSGTVKTGWIYINRAQ
jgi:gliding motility-associated-like protein